MIASISHRVFGALEGGDVESRSTNEEEAEI